MRMLLSLLAFSFAFSALAGSKIESWKSGEAINFVVRDEAGKFISHGEMNVESWNDKTDKSVWVARRADGTFVTGFKGSLEKFKVEGMDKEQLRLVVRNAAGSFVTWKAVDEFLTAGFEKRGSDTVYAIRYKGKFVNWAKAKLESWSNMKAKVLAVRDTQDSGNNGKLLAWIAGEKTSNGKIVYRDPETGRFVSPNK